MTVQTEKSRDQSNNNLGKVRGLAKSLKCIIWEPRMSVPFFMSIHQVDVEIYQSLSKNFDLMVLIEKK